MRRYLLAALLCSVILISLAYQAYAFTIDVTLRADPLELRASRVDSTQLRGLLYDARLLPEGYDVVSYSVLEETWAEVGTSEPGYEGDFTLSVESANVLGYRVLLVAISPMRTRDGRVERLERIRLAIECKRHPGGLEVKRRSKLADRYLDSLIGKIPEATSQVMAAGRFRVTGNG